MNEPLGASSVVGAQYSALMVSVLAYFGRVGAAVEFVLTNFMLSRWRHKLYYTRPSSSGLAAVFSSIHRRVAKQTVLQI